MKKAYRIKKNGEIKEVLKAKKSKGNQFFVVYKKNNHDKPHYRFAISVSKKYGNAVERNKAKRYVREIVRKLEIIENVDVFIVIKPKSKTLSFQEQTQQLTSLLRRQKIIGEKL